MRHLLYLIDAVALVEGNNDKLDPTDSLEEPNIAEDIKYYQQQEEEMKEVLESLSKGRKFWKGLIDQVKAVYAPRLIPIRENGIIIGWIDERTGMQPWFS